MGMRRRSLKMRLSLNLQEVDKVSLFIMLYIIIATFYSYYKSNHRLYMYVATYFLIKHANVIIMVTS